MNPDAATLTPTDLILHALALHDECSRGELLSAAGLQSYPELEKILLVLLSESKITAHWHDAGFRTYRLVEARTSNVPFSWLIPKPPE